MAGMVSDVTLPEVKMGVVWWLALGLGIDVTYPGMKMGVVLGQWWTALGIGSDITHRKWVLFEVIGVLH